MSEDTSTSTAPRPGLTWTFLAVAGLFAIGSTIQLFLAGLSTFDSAFHWEEHVFLGRIVSLFALVLPVLAYFARLSRPFLVLTVIAAVLYMLQVMLTMVDVGPLAALHAINALPLIIIPGLVTLRAYEIVRGSRTGSAWTRS